VADLLPGTILMAQNGWSEPELLAAARQGNLDAFEYLVALHERRIYALALRISGNREDAKDAMQEAFLRLHRHLSQIDSDAAIGPWLCTVVVNACRDIGRTKRRARLVPMEGGPDSRPDPAAGPEQMAAAHERERHLQAALRRLPETERAALLLREMEGLSTREVASALGSSETTVRSQISRARLRLRNLFKERFGGVR
jgi:RNA polymerase sigma-70 factor (ECF subfamily)